MFRPPDLVDRLAEVLGDVELVKHDLRPRNMPSRAGHERLPHVHGNRLDSLKLLLCQRFPELIAGGDCPIPNHLQHSALVNVGQNRDIIMPLAEALFVDADMLNIIGLPALKTSLDSGSHDGMDCVPGEPQQASGSADIRCRLKHADRERLEHQCKAGVLPGPRNCNRFDSAAGTLAAGNGGSDFSGELHRIEVSPCSLGSSVGASARLRTLGAAEFATDVFQLDDDAISRQIEVHVDDLPVIAEPEKLSVVCVEIVHPDKIQNQPASRDQPLKSPKNPASKKWKRLRSREKIVPAIEGPSFIDRVMQEKIAA